MALGKNVKTLRERRGWTLKDLSKRSGGVPAGSIGALEVRDSARSEFAVRLAQALGVDVSDLMDGDVTNQPLAPVDIAQAATKSVADTALICPIDQALQAIAALMQSLPENDRGDAVSLINTMLRKPAIATQVIGAITALVHSAKNEETQQEAKQLPTAYRTGT